MSDRDTPIEDRIEEELHHLLDFMEDESGYSESYKSMIGHFVRVMELYQKKDDSENARNIKLQELQQQASLSQNANAIKLQELQQQQSINEAANAIKLQELAQQKTLSEESHTLKLQELQQQKTLSDDANAIKLQELELKKTITKETWLTVGTHVAGLIVLMNHERAHVIASKAFGLVKRIV